MAEFKNNPELYNAIEQFVGKQNVDEAFQTIYYQTNQYLYMIINRNVQNDAVTQDLMQEVYLIVYQKLDTLENIYAFQKWLGCITTNVVNRYFRRNTNTFSLDEQMDSMEEGMWEEDSTLPLPEDIVTNKESQKYIWDIINGLPEKHRQAMIAFYFNELSIKEIADAMYVPENTVKTYLYRGKKKMKEDVMNLERTRGIKLAVFTMASTLLWLFKNDAYACEVPAGLASKVMVSCAGKSAMGTAVGNTAGIYGSSTSSGTVASGTASSGTMSSGATGSGTVYTGNIASGTGMGATIGSKAVATGAVAATKTAIATKIAIGTVIAGLLCGGAFATNHFLNDSRSERTAHRESKEIDEEDSVNHSDIVENTENESDYIDFLSDQYSIKANYKALSSGRMAPFAIGTNGKFWVNAVDSNNNPVMLQLDSQGKIYRKVECKERDVYFCAEGLLYAPVNNKIYTYDYDGNNTTSTYASEDEIILDCQYDSTGTTIWVYNSIDTYDSHDSVLYAKDLEGNIKQEFRESELFNKFNLNSDEVGDFNDSISYSEGPWYYIRFGENSNDDHFVLNVENGAVIHSHDYGLNNYESYVQLKTRLDYKLYDGNGNLVPINIVEGYGTIQRYIGENLLLYRDDSYKYHVFDFEGNMAFDATKYVDIGDFRDGIAAVSMQNDAGVCFASMINTKGEFILEPMEVQVNGVCEGGVMERESGIRMIHDIIFRQEYLVTETGEYIEYNASHIYIKEDDKITSYIEFDSGKMAVKPIDGLIRKD